MPLLGEQPVFVTLDSTLTSSRIYNLNGNITMTTNNYILCVNVGVN